MRAVHVPLAPSLECGGLPTLEPAGEEPDPPVGKREQAPRTPIESPHSAREPHLYSAGASPLLEWRRLPEEGLNENEGIVLKRRIQRSNVMRIRRTLAPGLLGLLGITLLASEAQACRGCGGGHGRTYHYNGAQGYWSGGGCPAPIAYARQPMAYAPPLTYTNPQATYAAPQSPAKSAPTPTT